MQPGDMFTTTRVFTQADFDAFARLSGDDNPIHVDTAFAAQTRFGRTVAHGMLLYSALCGAIHGWFPGARQLEQELMFPAPTFTDEAMTLTLVVTAVAHNQIELGTTIRSPRGELTCDGRARLAWEAR